MDFDLRIDSNGLWVESASESILFPLTHVSAEVTARSVTLQSDKPIFLTDPLYGTVTELESLTAGARGALSYRRFHPLALSARRAAARTLFAYRWPELGLLLTSSAPHECTRHAHRPGWVLPSLVDFQIAAESITAKPLTIASLTLPSTDRIDKLSAQAQALVHKGQRLLADSDLPRVRV